MRHVHWKFLSCFITPFPPPFDILLWPATNQIKIRTGESPRGPVLNPPCTTSTCSENHHPPTDIKSRATTAAIYPESWERKAESPDSMKTTTKKKRNKRRRGEAAQEDFFKSLSSINFDNIVQHAAKYTKLYCSENHPGLVGLHPTKSTSFYNH